MTDPGGPGPSPASADATFAILRRYLSPGSALAAKVLGGDATEARAEGAEVVLSDDRRLLDFGSYGVTLLGHRHPLVLAALRDELERMPTATRLLGNPTVAAFASELAQRCGGEWRVWLGSDGSDAVEAAVKLARRGSGRTRLLAVEGSFHGKTMGALAATANPAFRTGLEPLLGQVSWLPREDPEAARRELARGDVAALLFEPIQGEGGVRPLAPSVLRRWIEDARAAGAFAISDEVQVGLGRCGPFSPSLAAGLEPDAVLFGKALGGGLMPLSAVLAREGLAAPIVADPTWHTATFGGHPLACAAGRGALAALAREAGRGPELAGVLEAGLTELARLHPETIVGIRGAGLIWGVELASSAVAGAALVELAANGLLVSPCLGSNSTIRLLPPLVTEPDQAERALAILADSLSALAPYL